MAKIEDQDICTSDTPELDDDFFQNVELRVPVKKPVALRLEASGKVNPTWINQLSRRDMGAQHVQSKTE